MSRALLTGFAVTLAAAVLVTACSSGGEDGNPQPSAPAAQFVSWEGSSDFEVIKDQDGDTFRVLTASGCLWSDRYQAPILSWCRSKEGAAGRIWFGDGFVRVVSQRDASSGRCGMTLVEEASGRILDIYPSPVEGILNVTVGPNRATPCQLETSPVHQSQASQPATATTTAASR